MTMRRGKRSKSAKRNRAQAQKLVEYIPVEVWGVALNHGLTGRWFMTTLVFRDKGIAQDQARVHNGKCVRVSIGAVDTA